MTDRSETTTNSANPPSSGEPGERVPGAVHVVSAAAGNAETAAERRIHDHGISGRDRRHAVADGLDPARVLVAEHERQRHAGRLHEPVDGMEVGRAHPGAADPDEHVLRADGLRRRPVDQLERLVVLAKESGPHVIPYAARPR